MVTREIYEATIEESAKWFEREVNECFHCGYHYKDEGEEFARCHFEGWTAPCEYEDDYEEDCDD